MITKSPSLLTMIVPSSTTPRIRRFNIRAIDSGIGPKDGNGNPLLRRGLPDLEFWIGKKIGLGRPAKKSFLKEKKSLNKPISSLWIAGLGEKVTDNSVETLRSGRQGEGADTIERLRIEKVFSFQNTLICSSIPSFYTMAKVSVTTRDCCRISAYRWMSGLSLCSGMLGIRS